MSSIPRFFVLPSAIVGDTVTLSRDAAHHAATVLKLRVGEAVIIHDDTGIGYTCRLTQVAAKAVSARIETSYTVATEPRTRITIAQALPKNGDKLEQVLQHGTEIGAAGFLLFSAERSVSRIEGRDRIEKRLERWGGITQSAAEQSGRGQIPCVEWAASTEQVIRRTGDWEAVLLFQTGVSLPLRDALLIPGVRTATRVLLIVGPESGFTPAEVTGFDAAGCSVVSLGARVLRTETAAMVALAQFLFARNE